MGFLRYTKQPAASRNGILLGLAAPRYYNGYSPVLNWYKTAEQATISATVTFTGGGSPNILRTAHGLAVNDAVSFSNTGGALPTAINAGTSYYIKTIVNANTFTVSAYPPGSTVINMATAGTGVHSLQCNGIIAWNAGLLDPATGDIKPSIGVTGRTDFFFVHPDATQKAAGANFDGETWVAEWDGTGAGNIVGITPGNQTPVGSNKINFTMDTPQGSGVSLTLTVGANPADPPRNPRVYQARYASKVALGEITNPDWRAEMAKFPTLRFMDWQATNNSRVVDFSDLATESYYRWAAQLNVIAYTPPVGMTGNGPKGSVHPSIICKVLNETGTGGHVNIPTAFTDAAILEFVQYMRDHTTQHVTYEFSNEIFHYGFFQIGYCEAQGALIPAFYNPDDRYAQALNWYGYRSAQMMKIVRDAYADTSRWSGAITSQAVSDYPIQLALAGVTYWKTSTGSPLNIRDLFRGAYFAPYYGGATDGLGLAAGRYIQGIRKANPAVVTSAGHGRANGDRVKLFIYNGMTELNNVFCTVAGAYPAVTFTGGGSPNNLSTAHGYAADDVVRFSNVNTGDALPAEIGPDGTYYVKTVVNANTFTISATPSTGANTVINFATTGTGTHRLDTFQLSGVNSTSYTTFTGVNDYWVPAALWDLMDASEALYPGTNPSPYTYFNAQWKQAQLTGTCAAPGIVIPYPLNFYQPVWVAQKVIADANGLEMRQYEGGNHFIGSGPAQQYGGTPQLNKFVMQWGHSQDSADVQAAFCAAWNTLGGKEAAKFQEAGGISQFGCWAGIPLLADCRQRRDGRYQQSAVAGHHVLQSTIGKHHASSIVQQVQLVRRSGRREGPQSWQRFA